MRVSLSVSNAIPTPTISRTAAVLVEDANHHPGIAVGKRPAQERLYGIGVGVAKIRLCRCEKRSGQHEHREANESSVGGDFHGFWRCFTVALVMTEFFERQFKQRVVKRVVKLSQQTVDTARFHR
jgi:hypothetical protein